MNIFVTVGAQMPFDRLIRAVDDWVRSRSDVRCFAQVGPGGYRGEHMETVEFIEPAEYRERISQSGLIVSHAGMGSIITALQYGKPIVVMPRKAALRETRNDHQFATVDRFESVDGIFVSRSEDDIPRVLQSISDAPKMQSISRFASDDLITRIREFIES